MQNIDNAHEALPVRAGDSLHSGFRIDSSFDGRDIEIEDVGSAAVFIAKNFGEPDRELFANPHELKNNPDLAVSHISISNKHFTESANPEVQATAFVAKYEAAKNALSGLTKVETENFDGHIANKVGMLGFVTGVISAIKNPEIRKKVFKTTLTALMAAQIAACQSNGNAATPLEIFTETQPATETAVNTPGFIPASETQTPSNTEGPSSEVEQPSEVWQLSPDGHVYYNESELYGGLFTINKENPENVEKYWENTVRGLWNLNYVGENKVFLNQFPSADSLVDYLNNGGGPISNLWIPVNYPNPARQFWYHATLVPTEVPVDLSKIALSIYKPTKDEIYAYSPSYAANPDYLSFADAAGEVFIDPIQQEGKAVLRFTLRQDLLMDSDKKTRDESVATFLAITEDKTSSENLLAVNQLLNNWLTQMQTDDGEQGGVAWGTKWNPPTLFFWPLGATSTVAADNATTVGSPLSIR